MESVVPFAKGRELNIIEADGSIDEVDSGDQHDNYLVQVCQSARGHESDLHHRKIYKGEGKLRLRHYSMKACMRHITDNDHCSDEKVQWVSEFGESLSLDPQEGVNGHQSEAENALDQGVRSIALHFS